MNEIAEEVRAKNKLEQLKIENKKFWKNYIYIIISLLFFVLFGLLFIPLFLISYLQSEGVQISDTSFLMIWGILFLISLLPFIYRIIKFNQMEPISHNNTHFFNFQKISNDLEQEMSNKEPMKKNIIRRFEKEIRYMKREIEDFDKIKGIANETSLKEMKGLIDSLEKKGISSLKSKTDLQKIKEVILWLSYIYLDKNVNPYRSHVQEILNGMKKEIVEHKHNIFRRFYMQTIISKNGVIRFFSLLLIITLIISPIGGLPLYFLNTPIYEIIMFLIGVSVLISATLTPLITYEVNKK